MLRARTKSEAPRIGKKLGEEDRRNLAEVLKSKSGANLGEFLEAAYDGAGGAKRAGLLFGCALRSKRLKQPERVELTKVLANLSVQWEKMNPELGEDELAALTDDQIEMLFNKEFGLARLPQGCNAEESVVAAANDELSTIVTKSQHNESTARVSNACVSEE